MPNLCSYVAIKCLGGQGSNLLRARSCFRPCLNFATSGISLFYIDGMNAHWYWQVCDGFIDR